MLERCFGQGALARKEVGLHFQQKNFPSITWHHIKKGNLTEQSGALFTYQAEAAYC